MAITINGDGTLTGISVGGLPDGIVDADMLATSAVATAKIADDAVTAAKVGYNGAVLQVVKAEYSTTVTRTNDTTHFDTGLSASITPVAANSHIFITCYQAMYILNGLNNTGGLAKLLRGSTALESFDHSIYANGAVAVGFTRAMNFIYLDEPTYTLGNSITYKTQVGIASSSSSTMTAQPNSEPSTMILMEIAAS